MSRRTVAVALLLWAGLAPALAEDPPAATRPRLLQRVSKPDAKAAAAEVTAAGLEPDAVVLPTDTEYNDPRRADAVAAAAEALFAAGVPEIWLEIGVAGQTLDPENALTAARVYLKRVPRAKGLVVHWLFPRRFLSPPQSAEPWLRKFAEIGLPLIVMGDPEIHRTLEYTGLSWDRLEPIPQVAGAAPDIYFSQSIFQEGGADPAVVGRWLDTLAATARVPLFPCLRIGTPIEAEPLDLARFEKILEQIAPRNVKGVILEGSESHAKDWPRWREALKRILGR